MTVCSVRCAGMPRSAWQPTVGRDGGVQLLVDGRDPVASAATHAWLSGRTADRGVVVGGTTAITPPVMTAIQSSLAGPP
ncbi:hypothetical protein BH23ACT9_BH23ACT9_20210 [soil metagenome]